MYKSGLCLLIFSIVLFLGVLLVDIYTKESHQYFSLKLSRYFEDRFDFLKFYFWLFSYPLYYCIPFFVIAMLFFRRDKKEAIMGIFIVMLDSFTANTLKIILHDGRPCFYSFKISKNYGCSCAFGDPSGHSSATILFYYYIYYSFIKKNPNIGKAAKNLALIIWFLIFTNIGTSRVFYGKHFFMQVLLGWSLGLVNINIYRLIDKGQIFEVILNLPQIQHVELSKVSQINSKTNKESKDKISKNRNFYIYTIFIVFQLIAFLATVVSVTVALQFEDNPYHPYSQPVCDEKCFQGDRYLSYNSLRSTLMYQFFLFTLLLIKNRKTRIFFNNQKYYQESLSANKFFFALKRFVIFIVTMLPLLITFVLAKLMISVWLIVAVMLVIGIVQALFLTDLFPYMLKKCNAHIKGDLFIGFEN